MDAMPDERGDGGEWTLGGDCRSGRDSGAALMPEAVVGPLVLPATPDEWPSFLRARCDSGLDRIRELIAQLKDGEQRSPIATLGVWNDALAVGVLKDTRLLILKFSANGSFIRSWTPAELNGTYGRLRSPEIASDGSLLITTDNGSGIDQILRVVPHLS
jgi:hypothetical protein